MNQSSSSFAHSGNLEFIETQYQIFKTNPNAVGIEWKRFFEGMEFSQDGSFGLSSKELDVYELINAYRNYGHFEADLDPLTNTIAPSDQLKLSRFNLSEKDLEQKFKIGAVAGKPNATLREIIGHLKACYCGKLTVQVAEALPEVRNWFIKEFETNPTNFRISPAQKKSIYSRLVDTEGLEKFIHSRYVGAKRFSIEGADAMIPMLETLTERGSELGIEEVMLGMAHRGRVNTLVNFMGKHPGLVFADFNGPTEMETPLEDFDGDVKYHLGYVNERKFSSGRTVKISLAFNPSHLEAVNPVVLGQARAAQRHRKDTQARKKVVPVLIHGDAAFAGQGIVAETFQMAYVRGYTVGGTIHLSVDNQVGFTTNPENGRSSHYCSDLAKILATPVIHVNGDDVEACVRAMDIAVRYRQEWSRDIVVNLICYRRFGHNESDEPAFTQPLMYDIIKKHPTLRDIYAKIIARDQVQDLATSEALLAAKLEELQTIFEETKAKPPKAKVFKFEGPWKGLKKGLSADIEKEVNTSFPLSDLKKIGSLLSQLPAGFNPHPKINKLLENRKAMSEGREKIDWGTAELLAYGSLLHEGFSVRLSGQDCVRGTFTHRHAGVYDVSTGEPYFALKTITPEKVNFCVYDSILSEYGVLGFEYGNSVYDPNFLTIWEAQFGDFNNGAQIMIDQFIASAESKWQQMSGLTMLLPHGYEGQGPEHSSARLERFLQLSAQNNLQVMNLTTPAQIYHAFRRQMKRSFRKPMIVMSPKSLLRHPKAVSTLEDLAQGSFQEVLADTTLTHSNKVETLILCTGKVYYELLEEREQRKMTLVPIVRLEQIYPTPQKALVNVLKNYPNLKKIVWCQEEPKNMGAWSHVSFKLWDLLVQEGFKVQMKFAGRTERASPATGSIYRHKIEQQELLKQAFEI